MRVLYVYRTYYPDQFGGLQEAIRQICLATQPLGIENTIFTLSPNPAPEILNRPEATVVRCRSWAAPGSCDLGGWVAFRRFRQLAEQADLIHYFYPWPFADLLHHFCCPAKPTVLTYISDIVRQQRLGSLYAPLMRRTLKGMSAIVANSPVYVKSSPVLSSSLVGNRLEVIPLGIQEESYGSQEDTSVIERLKIESQQPFFLFVGALRYYKGLRYLIEAAKNVAAPVVIAGIGSEGSALRQQVETTGVTNVIFAGSISHAEKITLLRRCRALVLPSHLRSEAYGMVLIEAAMQSRPQISCNIDTGTSWINLDNKTGLVVEPAHPTALAAAMNHLLSNSRQADIFGLNARRRYEKYFSGKSTGAQYAQLYKRLVHSAA